MKIAIASDHAGYAMKEKLKEYLESNNHIVTDFGTNSPESVDYPDYGHPLADAVVKKEVDIGISLCGSGNGINMTVNKHQDIRSALCWNAEISHLARSHNDANICALPAKFVTIEDAKEITDVFLSTPFEGGRHCNRVEKIPLNFK